MSSGSWTPKVEFEFKRSAIQEFRKLDGDQKKKCLAQLLKIADNPLTGEALGNKYGVNLTGFRRIYVARKSLRIVWKIEGSKIVVVMAMGYRDKGSVYRTILQRLNEEAATWDELV